jgi:hypothetical protein
MRGVTKRFFTARRFMLVTLGIIGTSYALAGQPQGGESDWTFNATIIEACSCPNPCPCNFNSAKPAAHSGHEEWIKIKKETGEINGPLVGEIQDRTLCLTDYSPRKGLAKMRLVVAMAAPSSRS